MMKKFSSGCIDSYKFYINHLWVKDLRKQTILFAKSFLRRLHKYRVSFAQHSLNTVLQISHAYCSRFTHLRNLEEGFIKLVPRIKPNKNKCKGNLDNWRSGGNYAKPKVSVEGGKNPKTLPPPKPTTIKPNKMLNNSEERNVLEINDSLVERVQQSCKTFGVFARWCGLGVSTEYDGVEEGEIIGDQSMDEGKNPSPLLSHEDILKDKQGRVSDSKEVKNYCALEVTEDGEKEELTLIPEQDVGSNVRSNLGENASSQPWGAPNSLDKVEQEVDLVRKEEEVNYIINYLCDSVTKDILENLLDEIVDKDELELQKTMLRKGIMNFTHPPEVTDMEALIIELDNKENEALGIG
ncbi:hypothetical protein SUGI_0817630 [Cryptomeria japonica]|nr:hypothetical protein SUGI_0817630 [Cryptomeria japonica]